MPKIALSLNRILQGFLYILSAALVIYLSLFYIREWTKVINYYHSGTVLSEVDAHGDSLLVFVRAEQRDFLSPPYPSRGDTLISINDSTATRALRNAYFRSPQEIGSTVPVEFLSDGVILRTIVQFARPRTEEFYQLALLQLIRVLLVFAFIAVGMWAFLKRPESGGVRVLTLFSLSMAAFFTFNVIVLAEPWAPFDIPLSEPLNYFFQHLAAFFSTFWLHLQLLFPRPKKFLERRPVWAYLLCYAPVAVLILLAHLGIAVPNLISFLLITVLVILGFMILARSYVTARDSLEKRQTRLVLVGSGIGLASLFLLLLFAGILFDEWFRSVKWGILLINVMFLPVLLSPLSFAYAFGRYRLLEVEGKLKRGTRYVLVTVIMLAIFIGLLYLVGELFLGQFGVSDRTPTFLVALALALGFIPAWRKVQYTVEKRFYPERHSLRLVTRDFLQQIIAVPDREILWKHIEDRLRQSLKIEELYPVLKADDESVFWLNKGGTEEVTPFEAKRGIVETLQAENRPLLIDEAICCGRVALTAQEQAWLEQRKIAMLLPMVVQSQLIGFLGLGFKMGQEDYSPEDLQILSSLATQVALASENIRLLEENIDKKRMEEELRFAQRIQRGFLPRQLPETPGLEVAAESQFCLEVAGDYYDVIALPDGKTVLAVGDVSGKGAGAALLMANLQASLRTSVGVSPALADLVARINDLIYQNTPLEQYITFFVAVFDPQTKSLTCVNAGHNPPLLLRESGESMKLEKGGLILGYLSHLEYEQEMLPLKTGDLIFMYTDGLSEAMNASGQEFGEERIFEFVQSHRDLIAPEILSQLQETVKQFTGGVPWSDDLTLLLARVK